MIDERNKIQQLEDKISELERKIENFITKEDSIREVQARLAGYQDNIRSESGYIYMKDNFEIKHRRAAKTGFGDVVLNPEKDTVVSMSFTKQKDGALNHIFIGDASKEGNYNNSCLIGTATHKKDAPNVNNNGTIQLNLIRDEYLSGSGGTTKEIANFALYPTELFGITEKGECAFLNSTGNGSFTQIAHLEGNSVDNAKSIFINKDGIYINGDLILESPDGSNWAVRIDNSGNLTRTKL